MSHELTAVQSIDIVPANRRKSPFELARAPKTLSIVAALALTAGMLFPDTAAAIYNPTTDAPQPNPNGDLYHPTGLDEICEFEDPRNAEIVLPSSSSDGATTTPAN